MKRWDEVKMLICWLYVSMNETYSDSSVVMVVALFGKCASFRVMFFARVISRPRKCRL